MYARQTADTRGQRDLKVPPNYGGSAFYNIPEAAPIQKEAPLSNVTECKEADIPSLAQDNAPSKNDIAEKTGLFRMFGDTSGGIGLEELLILGLALLISQNDTKDDLAFLLLLLVFIK